MENFMMFHIEYRFLLMHFLGIEYMNKFTEILRIICSTISNLFAKVLKYDFNVELLTKNIYTGKI